MLNVTKFGAFSKSGFSKDVLEDDFELINIDDLFERQ